MAFRHVQFGATVSSDPTGAHQRLIELFAQHGILAAVAARLGVERRTLARWIVRLVALGLEDPRDSAAVPRRKPKAA